MNSSIIKELFLSVSLGLAVMSVIALTMALAVPAKWFAF